ncbi:hypothetical protein MPLSOD_410076 [Mesorhizobium sp. SOD10]|nr:hypothetical protein MPLSOD_410076 [Mesorhizobium sp. SOD10]
MLPNPDNSCAYDTPLLQNLTHTSLANSFDTLTLTLTLGTSAGGPGLSPRPGNCSAAIMETGPAAITMSGGRGRRVV